MSETQITSGRGGRILTNCNVWSPDSRWIVYDIRSDTLGDIFDGTRIELVHVETGEVRVLYEAQRGACCGVATFDPLRSRVVFILGPEDPAPDWRYGPTHRQGVVVELGRPGVAISLDARDIVPPFTPGALRGGSHVHIYNMPELEAPWVSFTYNDHVLATRTEPTIAGEMDQRNIGISVPIQSVVVPKTHPHNHDGTHFTILVTRTVDHPTPGSDEIQRAFEEGWIGANGYRRADGTWQRRALAFQGEVITVNGDTISEVFVVDLPDNPTLPGDDGPLEGTSLQRPRPPRGTVQRRLTFTADRRYPGLQGPRHWLRSSPDGSRIAFLMRDDNGTVQLWTISPNGGKPRQLTHDTRSIASAFTWSPNGYWIAYAADNSIFVVDTESGQSLRLTTRSPNTDAPLPLACVFSPDGKRIAYLRNLLNSKSNREGGTGRSNQIFTVEFDESAVSRGL